MKVNFNGMRKNATRAMNELHEAINEVLDNSIFVDTDLQENLIKKFNESAYHVDVFNCLEDDKGEDFDCLDISINRFEE